MPDVDLGDVTIHYEEAAADKPRAIIFCHGLGGSGAGLVSHFDFWSQYFRCLSWDNRGLGKSSAAAKYNRKDVDEFDEFNVRRGFVLSRASYRAANSFWGRPFSYRSSFWFFDPFTGFFTYLPYSPFVTSPFGFYYIGPRYIYQQPSPPRSGSGGTPPATGGGSSPPPPPRVSPPPPAPHPAPPHMGQERPRSIGRPLP